MGEDRTGHLRSIGRRLAVNQAADVLGVTPEARRVRLRRRTIAVEREAGRAYVVLDADQPRQTTNRTAELIATLREQLAAERQAHAEARRLLAAALGRIPALEAPEAPQTGEDAPEGRESRTAAGHPQTPAQVPERRSWWKRVFGG